MLSTFEKSPPEGFMAGCIDNYIALFVTVETHFVTGEI